jgi:hypothetical protein
MYFYEGACGKTENAIAIKQENTIAIIQENQSEQGKITSDKIVGFPSGR